MPVEIREIQLKADVVSGRQESLQAKAGSADCPDPDAEEGKVSEKEREDIIEKCLQRMIQWYNYNKNR